jgi:DNA-binding protein HU-beta
MTQTQIVQTLADSCEVTKKVAKSLLDTLAHTAITEVKKNGLFVIPGLGRLVRVDRKERMGRNPATGLAIKIAAKKVVKFRVAKAAKDAIVPAEGKRLLRTPVFQRPAQNGASDPNTPLGWPWPITVPPEGSGAKADLFFSNKYSGLWLCGYRVGKTSSLNDSERRRFLDHFFRNFLPEIVSRYHTDSYGQPGTEKRLQKMANVMAANCRNFKKNDVVKYEVAIADYEQDLAYLKQSYYRAGSFPWPPTED